jgi:hypothetical protein
MKRREQREQELISSGLVDVIKEQYKNTQYNIPNKYFVLMADYIDSIGQLDKDGGLYLDAVEVAKQLPRVLNSIIDTDLNGIYGKTDGNTIAMNIRNDYETNKLFFFHELTHAIQTRKVDNHEECSFYDGKTGMFLTEGATQYTAEILYNISNGGNIQYREQKNSVRGQNYHTTYSPLSQYQLNGNILMLLSTSLGVPLNQLLALGYRKNGRKLLKDMYESFPGQEEKFEEFMLDLEKVYSLDKLILNGQINEISGKPRNIIMQDGQQFAGNLQIQDELINKVERELAANFIANNEPDYILANYKKIYMYLTTPELKINFQNAISQIAMMNNNQTILPDSEIHR